MFVAVGGYYSSTIVTSTDGVTWTDHSPTFEPYSGMTLQAVAYGNGMFEAVGHVRTDRTNGFLTSTNGLDWHREGYLEATTLLSGIAYGEDRFVAVGYTDLKPDGTINGVIAVGYGPGLGINFVTSRRLLGVAYGDGIFTVVGESGVILTSNDLVSWSSRPSGTTDSFDGVAYGNGAFVTVGGGPILESGYVLVTLSGQKLSGVSGFELTATGGTEGKHRLQATSDLRNNDWVDLINYSVVYTNARPAVELLDTQSNFPRRFYRIVSP